MWVPIIDMVVLLLVPMLLSLTSLPSFWYPRINRVAFSILERVSAILVVSWFITCSSNQWPGMNFLGLKSFGLSWFSHFLCVCFLSFLFKSAFLLSFFFLLQLFLFFLFNLLLLILSQNLLFAFLSMPLLLLRGGLAFTVGLGFAWLLLLLARWLLPNKRGKHF